MARRSIVTSVRADNREAAVGAIAALPPGPDPIELRADRLSADEVAAVVSGTERELIVTVRRTVDGGSFDGDEKTRHGILAAALAAGARWVDVEWGSELAVLAEGADAGRVILSDHGATCETRELERRVEAMSSSGAARLKIVAPAERPAQILAIRDLLRRRSDDRLCAFAMGASGALSRVLAPQWGSWGTYASAVAGAETAPGQFSAAQLRDSFDVLSIGEATRIVALVGREILPTSPSPAMHNAGYDALDMDRVYVPLQTAHWEDAVELADALGLAGLAVTMPFKGDAAGHVSSCDDLSASAHAVNTIVYGENGSSGSNTDGPAAVALMEARGLEKTDRVDVLGAGGTGRAIATALAQRGIDVGLWSREAGPSIATRPAIERRTHDERRPGESHWLVNTTPRRDDTLIGCGPPARRGVLEAIYGTSPTSLVLRGREAGLQVIDGLELLVAQAELQFERHTGRKPPSGLFAAVGQRHIDSLG
ncbi:MAG: type I 3-dehydroquinate dehydratase [Acidobacteria bacterium]|nr:type I 3-dehydroquinate dehydratase [Acidobacteriota bacterium]NIM64335.1 type I 3-dehydroquinate dehydratase [Acidobacteriota bacterium]NIO58520.1 type I 3-dehydroquinate dehydratase [Acidobacteriota bacterium]NIQ29574.1 type I 3-dehydroquinate dehydratase [Acidobacteriota bacterium]NIQ84270.1 type I 3-dehydroquinate dehydratase [Acidobacteriota bacterium]